MAFDWLGLRSRLSNGGACGHDSEEVPDVALRRVAPTAWQRMKYGAVTGVGTTIATAIIAALAIHGVTASWAVVGGPIFAGAIAGSIAVGVAAAYLRGRLSQLPDSLIDDVGADGIYKCGFCTEERLREAVELTKPYYEHEYVAPDVALQWRMKNPTGFVQIVNSAGELCASFGILGLTKGFTEQFMAGKVADTQLSSEDVLTPEKSRRAENLYISGVVVRDAEKPIGHKRASVMLWSMLHYMKQVYGKRKERRLYAVAVNQKSERMLRRFGFQLLATKDSRVDRCPLYALTLTKSTWIQLMQEIPDYSRMCQCDFRVSGDPVRRDRTRKAEKAIESAAPDGHDKVRVLFVAGDRGGTRTNQIQTHREFDSIQRELRGAKHRDRFAAPTAIHAVTHQKITAAYRDGPNIMHFAGHGDDRSLSFIVDQGLLVSQAPIMADQLGRILGNFPERIRLCVLNACGSDPVASHLVRAKVVDAAIGWPDKVSDGVAIAFTEALYRGLGDGLSIARSVALASESSQATTPAVLHMCEGCDPDVNPFVPTGE